MKKYLTAKPYKGGRRRIREAIQELGRLQRLRFGRRPGRLADVDDRCCGHLDKMTAGRANTDCRIYWQNVGTLKVGKDLVDTEDSLEILSKLDVDISGLTEINKNYSHPLIRRCYARAVKEKMRGAEAVVAQNSNYKVKGINKPGGIMMIRSKRIKGMGSPEADLLGRWVKTTVVHEEVRMAIYALYVPSDADLGGR